MNGNYFLIGSFAFLGLCLAYRFMPNLGTKAQGMLAGRDPFEAALEAADREADREAARILKTRMASKKAKRRVTELVDAISEDELSVGASVPKGDA